MYLRPLKTRTGYIIFLALVLVSGLATYLYSVWLRADTISITAPPWDFCGFHETRDGTALSCIAFDVTPIVIK